MCVGVCWEMGDCNTGQEVWNILPRDRLEPSVTSQTGQSPQAGDHRLIPTLLRKKWSLFLLHLLLSRVPAPTHAHQCRAESWEAASSPSAEAATLSKGSNEHQQPGYQTSPALPEGDLPF